MSLLSLINIRFLWERQRIGLQLAFNVEASILMWLQVTMDHQRRQSTARLSQKKNKKQNKKSLLDKGRWPSNPQLYLILVATDYC
jgi:hypothetical protein